MKRILLRYAVPGLILLILVLFPGLVILPEEDVHSHDQHRIEEKWACPMLCVVLQNPGLCPVCGMELEMLAASSGSVTISAAERRLTGLTLVPVEMKRLQTRVEIPGEVTEAETGAAVITAWTSGRIDSFHAPATGEIIGRGAIVARIYSPELIEAQHDLLSTLRVDSGGRGIYEGAENRLRQLGASQWIIDLLVENGQVMETLPVTAAYSGTVTDRLVEDGDWVQKGQVLLRTSNLTDIWIEAHLLENQSMLLKTGDSVLVGIASGEILHGVVTHKDPFFDPVSRSLTARIEVSSAAASLLPGELVTVQITAEAGGTEEPDIAIPASSALVLGSRSLVYAIADDSSRVRYTGGIPSPSVGVDLVPVSVTLGQISMDSLGNSFYSVISGLSPGAVIADNAAFLIDSQAELTGLESLMRVPDTE